MRGIQMLEGLRVNRIVSASSLAICSIIMFFALIENHNSREVREMSLLELAIPLILSIGILGWPWILAFFTASKPNSTLQIVVFSVLAIILAVYISSAVRTAPAEGIGWCIIIYALSVWVLYPITLLLRFIKLGGSDL